MEATAAQIDWLLLAMGLFGGLALFLAGLDQLSEGLKQVAGTTLRLVLERLTTNRITGAVVTDVLNSSSVTTVLVVDFQQAGPRLRPGRADREGHPAPATGARSLTQPPGSAGSSERSRMARRVERGGGPCERRGREGHREARLPGFDDAVGKELAALREVVGGGSPSLEQAAAAVASSLRVVDTVVPEIAWEMVRARLPQARGERSQP